MAKKKFRVHHPRNDAQVAVTEKHPFLVAHGRGDATVACVKGFLTPPGEGPREGKTLRDPECWMILFEDFPVVVGEGKKYTLEVTGPKEPAVIAFTVRKVSPALVAYPSAKDEVCQDNFVAYGTSPHGYPVKATLTFDKAPPGPVTVEQFRGPPNWLAQFTNLPGLGKARLHVFDGDTPPNIFTVPELEVIPSPDG